MSLEKRVQNINMNLEGVQHLGTLDDIIQKSTAQVMDFEAIPLEQLKGDIARAGHKIKQATALDAEGRRLFFTDDDGQYLFAEFGTQEEGFEVKRIAHQSLIAKDYDVVGLIPSEESKNLGETVTTTHEEKDVPDEIVPGQIPGGTPGDAPEDNNRGWSEEEKPPAREVDGLGLLGKATDLLAEMKEAGIVQK